MYRSGFPLSLRSLLRCVVLMLVVALAITPLPLGAQSPAPPAPTLRITQIDTSQFPIVHVSVYGDRAPAATTQFHLYESGAERPGTKAVTQMGVQVALVFDASNNVRQAGLTNAPRLQEVKDTIDSFARTNFLDDERDWLTFIALGDDATPQVIGPRLDDAWENYDYQAVWNSVILYEPREGSTVTPLYDLVKFAVQQFAAPKLPMNQERHIVVFSDGSDQVSVLQSEQVIGLANQHNIRVHTVQLGNPAPQSERNLKQLSELTGGTYVSLDSIQALAPIVDAMRVTVDQTVLTYRSQRADPGEIRVEAILSDNQVINATDRAPAVNIQPAAITVLQPQSGMTLERSGTAWDSALESLMPATLPVQVAIQWPDGRTRDVKRLEIEVGGKTEVVDSPPFDAVFEVPIPLMGAGEYSVRVRALDELGVTSTSDPVRLTVTELRPSAPTPTPIPTATATATPTPNATATVVAVAQARATATTEAKTQENLTAITAANADLTQRMQQLSWVTIASAALALIALMFAIYVLSSRDRRKRATEIIAGTIQSVTEPFIRSGRKSSGGEQAHLVLVDNGGTSSLPGKILLQAGGVRIGRDPSVSNVILDDRRVSRFHCQIREEMGGFRLLDEGSVSGTYVNDGEVGIQGQTLKSGDLVSIGPVVYRFEVTAGARPAASAVGGESADATVPIGPRN